MHRNEQKWKRNNPKPMGFSKNTARGRLIAIQGYLKKQEKSEINNLTLHLKQLEKEEMKNPRVSRRKAKQSKAKSLSCVWLFVNPWTVAHQAPPFIRFSRQEYWNVLPFPSPGDLPNPGIEPRSPTLQADAFNLCTTREPLLSHSKSPLALFYIQ